MQNFGVMTLVAGTPVVRSVRLFSCLPSTTRRRFFFHPNYVVDFWCHRDEPVRCSPLIPRRNHKHHLFLPQRRFRTAEPR